LVQTMGQRVTISPCDASRGAARAGYVDEMCCRHGGASETVGPGSPADNQADSFANNRGGATKLSKPSRKQGRAGTTRRKHRPRVGSV
jgi:hypothetical protein